MAEENNKVETFTRFSAVVPEMNDAFVFVMEYMDKAGEKPSVEINARYSEENGSHEFLHYHVSVFGVMNPL